MQPFKYNPNFNSGSFRHRIIFLKSTIVKGELGQEKQVWNDFKSSWAMIKTLKGSEYFAAAAVQAERTYRFVVRYTADITSDMRINFNGRIFDIIEPPINDDEANKTLTIIAKESV